MRKKWNKRVLAAVMAAAMILGTSTTAFANASPPEGQEAAQEQSASAGENGQTENVPAEVAPEERLTDEVYHYDTKERVFEKADRFQQRKLDQAIDGVKDAVKERLQTPKHKATEISL